MQHMPLTGARVRRTIGGALCAAGLALQWGCYSYLPVQSAPPAVAERVAVQLTDAGRVALAERLGTGVDQVRGTVLSHNSDGVVLAVSGVTDIRGGSSLWSGEEVSIPSNAILGFRPRQLSKGRSVLLAGGLVFVLAALTFGTTLDLFGDEGPDGGDTVDTPDDRPPDAAKFPVGGTLPFPRFP